MNLFITLGLLLVSVWLSYQVMRGLSRLSSRSYFLFRIFLFPGVAIHELAHALACLATNTPIEHISFWTETGGQVIHHKPKYSLLTQPIISFAPFPVGIALMLWLSQIIRHGPWPLAVGAGLLLISVAATLAPSKADLKPAVFSMVLLILVCAVLLWRTPELVNQAATWLTSLNRTLEFAVLILAGLWTALLLLPLLFRKAH